jgi:RNA binding exosome subunit
MVRHWYKFMAEFIEADECDVIGGDDVISLRRKFITYAKKKGH